MKKRLVLIGSVSALVLVAALAALYFLGTPSRTAQPSQAGTSAQDSRPSQDVAEADEAPADSSPLAIEIPGCVCHSDDPEVVTEHAAYRMSQCAGCHEGSTPTGR